MNGVYTALRTGTEAQRAIWIVPKNVLIFTTDTKKLYIGDGVSVGGISVAGGLESVDWNDIQNAPKNLADLDSVAQNALNSLSTQIDNKIEFFSSVIDPATNWSNEEKLKHKDDLWYDLNSKALYTFDGINWIKIEDNKALEAYNMVEGKSTVFYGSNAPTGAVLNDIWQDTTTNITKIKTSSGWQSIANFINNTNQLTDGAGLGTKAFWTNVTGTGKPADGATKNIVTFSTNPPSTPSFGDIWTRTTDNQLYTYNGNSWIAGKSGADAPEKYIWVKYADTPTTGMSDSPTGKTYMGVAYNKTTAMESTNYSDYIWSLIKGTDGTNGLNSAPVFLYRKNTSTTAPALFSGTFTYNFSTKTLSGGTLNSWTTTAPTLNKGEYLWMSQATASNTGNTDDIPASEFNTPTIIAIGGIDGVNGTSTFTYYQTTAPTTPKVNELWYNSHTTTVSGIPSKNVARWNGSAWQVVSNAYSTASEVGAVATDLSNAPNTIKNSSITINSNGTLSGAGSGQVTPSGIGAETPVGATTKANTAEANAKSYADLQLLDWNLSNTDLVIENKGRTIRRTSTGTTWDRRAYATNFCTGSAYLRFTCDDKNANLTFRFMMGLTANPTASTRYSALDYCWFIDGANNAAIYEGLSSRGYFASKVPAGTVFEIIYNGNKIIYKLNGVVRRTLSVQSGLKLYLSSSFLGQRSANDITFGSSVSADMLIGSVLQSSNWSATAGSQFDLDNGSFKIGGSNNPNLSWENNTLAVSGLILDQGDDNALVIGGDLKSTSESKENLTFGDFNDSQRISTCIRWNINTGIKWIPNTSLGYQSITSTTANQFLSGKTTHAYFSNAINTGVVNYLGDYALVSDGLSHINTLESSGIIFRESLESGVSQQLLYGTSLTKSNNNVLSCVGMSLQILGTGKTSGAFYTGTVNPTNHSRLNYDGYFYPTFINLSGSGDTTVQASHYFCEVNGDGFVRPKTLANVKAEIAGDKAPLDNPLFKGIPKAPTAPVGTNTTQLATTAFVLANQGIGCGLGIGQSVQVINPIENTAYKNTSGKTIFVFGKLKFGSNSRKLEVSSDTTNWVAFGEGVGISYNINAYAIVPNNFYYRFTVEKPLVAAILS